MTMHTPGRHIGQMKRTPVILDAILRDVTQKQAQQATDGPDGWSVVEVVCHLRDFEKIFYNRAVQMLEEDQPTLQPFDHEALAVERDYASQNLAMVLKIWRDTRRQFIDLLKGLDADQWSRSGLHPEYDTITVLEQAMQVGTHDVVHIEQIVRALDLAGR
jgi:uncharacterized damage-inducible protein DinB